MGDESSLAGQVVLHAAQAGQLALGVVFLLAAVPKLRAPSGFVQAVRGYELLPAAMVRPAAFVLIGVEAFLAVALITGRAVGVALPVAIATVLVFMLGVGVNLRRGRRVRCGCFGGAGEVLSARTMARLVILLVGATLLLVLHAVADGSVWTIGLLTSGGAHLAGLAGFWLLLGLWLLQLPELTSLLRGSRPIRPAPGRVPR